MISMRCCYSLSWFCTAFNQKPKQLELKNDCRYIVESCILNSRTKKTTHQQIKIKQQRLFMFIILFKLLRILVEMTLLIIKLQYWCFGICNVIEFWISRNYNDECRFKTITCDYINLSIRINIVVQKVNEIFVTSGDIDYFGLRILRIEFNDTIGYDMCRSYFINSCGNYAQIYGIYVLIIMYHENCVRLDVMSYIYVNLILINSINGNWNHKFKKTSSDCNKLNQYNCFKVINMNCNTFNSMFHQCITIQLY